MPGQPVAELTKLDWVVISPGQENTATNMLYSKTTVHDYENLSSFDVLRIEENYTKGNMRNMRKVWYMRNFKSSWGGVQRNSVKQIYFGKVVIHIKVVIGLEAWEG